MFKLLKIKDLSTLDFADLPALHHQPASTRRSKRLPPDTESTVPRWRPTHAPTRMPRSAPPSTAPSTQSAKRRRRAERGAVVRRVAPLYLPAHACVPEVAGSVRAVSDFRPTSMRIFRERRMSRLVRRLDFDRRVSALTARIQVPLPATQTPFAAARSVASASRTAARLPLAVRSGCS